MDFKYKTELHCHTSEASRCATENTADTVKKYIEAGYTTLTLTNHFARGHMYEHESFDDYVDRYFGAVRLARDSADGAIHIICGMELNLSESSNDYLVFGASEELIRKSPGIFDMSISEAHDYLASFGCIVLQAHPMRFGITMIRPEWVDGYEVLNTHTAWDSHNKIARLWAQEVGGDGKILTSGTDHHDADNMPTGGIITAEPITSEEELLSVLRSSEYELLDLR